MVSPSNPPKLGVLQLKTTFPRPPGDVGNLDTWTCPTVIRVVEEADSASVVGGTWGTELVDAFVREGKRLMEEENCVAFVTSCGFLATMHPLLRDRLPFMATSSLMQVAWLQKSLASSESDGIQKVGVVTFNKGALTKKHFECVGADPETPYEGVPQPGIFSKVLSDQIPYDHDGMAKEVVEAAQLVISKNPGITVIVLECTNMPPFAAEVTAATGLPTYDIVGLGEYMYAAAVPKSWRK